jgi:hypothetical protein
MPRVGVAGDRTYEFYSEGPVGKIRKVVAYQMIDKDFFNLAFGDWNEERKKIDDSSTAARTRLYQIAIADNLLEINENFEVHGFYKEAWEAFRGSRNYEAFLIRRK